MILPAEGKLVVVAKTNVVDPATAFAVKVVKTGVDTVTLGELLTTDLIAID
jgi:hypothetical protein